MGPILLDGKLLAAEIKEEIRAQVGAWQAKGVEPSLAVILVGSDPASEIYVAHKTKDCQEVGIRPVSVRMDAGVSSAELLDTIRRLNEDPSVHGILCQLPLPNGLSEEDVIRTIDPLKDVDGFHPLNVGSVMNGKPIFAPCTPAGIMALLRRFSIDPAGKRCVVIGRSNIVGKPMAMLMLHADATVTVCHSRTKNMDELVRQADIVVTAVGKAGLIRGDMIRPGAVVVDVGMNRGADGKLCGDVDFASVAPLASAITPVPGGVGPMTRAMLLKNTMTACQIQYERGIR